MKVTKKEFIQALEENEGCKTNKELAAELGISERQFYNMLKRYRNDIRDAGRELVKSLVLEQIQNLKRNARKGDTQAAKYLTELSQTVQLESELAQIRADLEQFKAEQEEKRKQRAEVLSMKKAVNA